MIIIGWSHHPTILMQNVNHECKVCKRETPHALVRIVKTFNLFFIPILPYSFEYYLHCSFCGSKKDISSYEKNQLLDKYNSITMGAEERNAILDQKRKEGHRDNLN